MFIINGQQSAWKIIKGEGSFTVQNSSGTCSMEVQNADMEKLNADISGDEKTIIKKDIYPDTGLVIRYDDKTMVPQAFGCGEKRKDTLMAAISVKIKPGYKITSIYNEGVMVYAKDFDRFDHIELIGNFSKKLRDGKDFYPYIAITTTNEQKKGITTYDIKFNQSSNQVSTTMTNVTFDKNPKKGTKGHINTFDFVEKSIRNGREILPKFYPNSPSNTIICDEGDYESLKQVVEERKGWRKFELYNVVRGINEENLQKIVDDGYTAVSVYTANEIDAREMRNADWRSMLFGLDEKFCSLFDTIYLIGSNGTAYKLKVGGTMMLD